MSEALIIETRRIFEDLSPFHKAKLSRLVSLCEALVKESSNPQDALEKYISARMKEGCPPNEVIFLCGVIFPIVYERFSHNDDGQDLCLKFNNYQLICSYLHDEPTFYYHSDLFSSTDLIIPFSREKTIVDLENDAELFDDRKCFILLSEQENILNSYDDYAFVLNHFINNENIHLFRPFFKSVHDPTFQHYEEFVQNFILEFGKIENGPQVNRLLAEFVDSAPDVSVGQLNQCFSGSFVSKMFESRTLLKILQKFKKVDKVFEECADYADSDYLCECFRLKKYSFLVADVEFFKGSVNTIVHKVAKAWYESIIPDENCNGGIDCHQFPHWFVDCQKEGSLSKFFKENEWIFTFYYILRYGSFPPFDVDRFRTVVEIIDFAEVENKTRLGVLSTIIHTSSQCQYALLAKFVYLIENPQFTERDMLTEDELEDIDPIEWSRNLSKREKDRNTHLFDKFICEFREDMREKRANGKYSTIIELYIRTLQCVPSDYWAIPTQYAFHRTRGWTYAEIFKDIHCDCPICLTSRARHPEITHDCSNRGICWLMVAFFTVAITLILLIYFKEIPADVVIASVSIFITLVIPLSSRLILRLCGFKRCLLDSTYDEVYCEEVRMVDPDQL